MKLKDFLFELGVEELPSHAVKALSEALASNIKDSFLKFKIAYTSLKCFGTPRRLAVLVKDVESTIPPQKNSRLGPRVLASMDENNNPLPALLGFAKSCGVEITDLVKITTPKGECWAYESEKTSLQTVDLLLDTVKEAINGLPIQKLMTWGEGIYKFSRPVHWAVMKFGNDTLSGDLLGVKIDSYTHGHRFHNPEAIEITSPDLYEAALENSKVIANFSKRRQTILSQIDKIAKENELEAIVPSELLDEVTSIVEWPNALLATFSVDFLQVPEEVLIESMQQHQKCFALRDKQGKLSAHFITVTNIESKDFKSVIAGNEKVMHARLSDAAFFFKQDKSKPLANYIKNMSEVVFHAQLGTLADKTARLAILIEYLAKELNLDMPNSLRAAAISKCDLLTNMVGEFPELQGVMGYYYALHDKENPEVALAIREHYLPRFSADDLPESTLGKALSLVDRIDTLVGLFAIGKKPTGVKDPFKLRRHALAVVRILLQLPVNLSLTGLIKKSQEAFGNLIPNSNDFIDLLRAFIFERMQSYYQTQGIDSQFLAAVKVVQDDILFDINNRIVALIDFINLPDAAALAFASKRVSNLLSQISVDSSDMEVDVSLLVEPSEIALLKKIDEIESLIESFYLARDYGSILNCLAEFKAPLSLFFDEVMVMADDPAIKLNRLRLLNKLQKLLRNVADISLLNI